MKQVLLIVMAILLVSCNQSNTMDKKIDHILSQLTLEEKVSLIHGNTFFTTPAIPRLGIPALYLSDGPCGVREEHMPHSWDVAHWPNDSSAYFPALTSLAATWNTELAVRFGHAYAEEALVRGKNIMLSPGINIHRTPLGGRNWEYMTEDPFLAGQFAVPFIQAAQSKGIAVCAKHYAANNQEYERNTIDVEMSERALREIYLPAFEAAVKEGGVLSIMGAYNKFRGQFCCHNEYLVNKILKGEWQFPGVYMSDWGGTHSTLEAALYGLDLEMYPVEGVQGDYYLGQRLLDSISAGKIDPKVVDDKVKRILYLMAKLDLFGKPEPDTAGMAERLATPERAKVALDIAEEAVVLLKNENILPLDFSKIRTLAVIGDNATRKHAYGGWSCTIKAKYEITPLEGLKQKLGDSLKINFAQGYNQSKDLQEVDRKLIQQAAKVAAASDAVIIVGGLNHETNLDCEGSDKLDMMLPYGQDELIKAVLKANPNTVVVIIAGSPVDMNEWLPNAKGLVYTSYLGMETGMALANILTGDVNPSGKLPYTLPVRLEDTAPHSLGDYPGTNGKVVYNDDIYVGYRYFDTKNIKTQFPFGFGLSYTTFAYDNISVETLGTNESLSCTVSFNIKNTGNFDGKESAQVYVRDLESKLPRPLKELKGFAKVSLQKGESKRVKITLNQRAFQYYDPEVGGWVLEPGKFEILVGSASNKIELSREIVL